MAGIREYPAQEKIKDLFIYKNGSLYKKSNPKIAVGLSPANKYSYVSIGRSKYVAHRLIWIYHNGIIPKGMIVDHIDKNPRNNKIENLRLLTYSQNSKHTTRKNINESGFRCISWSKSSGKWICRVTTNLGKITKPFDCRIKAARFIFPEILSRLENGIDSGFFLTEESQNEFFKEYPEMIKKYLDAQKSCQKHYQLV